MRRTHLRGHGNILKRLLLHAAGCNLGLWMQRLTGCGTPRALQGARPLCGLTFLRSGLFSTIENKKSADQDSIRAPL
jgi:hypothetical protein